MFLFFSSIHASQPPQACLASLHWQLLWKQDCQCQAILSNVNVYYPLCVPLLIDHHKWKKYPSEITSYTELEDIAVESQSPLLQDAAFNLTFVSFYKCLFFSGCVKGHLHVFDIFSLLVRFWSHHIVLCSAGHVTVTWTRRWPWESGQPVWWIVLRLGSITSCVSCFYLCVHACVCGHNGTFRS